MRSQASLVLVAAAMCTGATTVHAADNPAEALELPTVLVVGTTPLPGLGVPLADVPANVQMFGNRAIGTQRPPTLTQFLDQNATSVSATSGQGNAFQQAITFRGFAASPLLGTPQGMSVFQDGVRVNEAFGDVVNWDLLPPLAISSIQLIPGSMPAFGLNTLGGALAVYTKSGAQYPGANVQIGGGSFGAFEAQAEAGGAQDKLDWYATGRYVNDQGWAEHNPSRLKHFSDTVALDPQWTLTLAGRYNYARIRIADLSGNDPALDGTHDYARFSPAIGVNYKPSAALVAYAGYNQGMRAPTPIELTCADPEAPCKLPNQFLADPPLQKVVSKTFEAGARGNLGVAATWSAAVYRTELYDDIQFIASGGGTNAGYFQNVGQTRRQGVELAASTRVGDWSFDFHYARVLATYRSTFVALSPNNSSANADGAIVVRPGDSIPGIPRDSVKLRVEFEPAERFAIGLNMLYASSQYALGDENNKDRNGPLPPYTAFNLDARYDVTPALRVLFNIANLFDRTYQTVGLVGANFFTGPNNTFGPAQGIPPASEQFRAPAAPRGIWVGIRYAFDRPPPAI